jgi:hypothetical protein
MNAAIANPPQSTFGENHKKAATRLFAFLGAGFSLTAKDIRLFRIGLGAVVIIYAITLIPDAVWFFSDVGFLPAKSLFERFQGEAMPWSFLYISNFSLFPTLLLCLLGVCGLLISFGICERILSIMSCMLVISFVNRNFLISDFGDNFLAILLLVSSMLPVVSRTLSSSSFIISGGSIFFVIQISFFYWFCGSVKDGTHWISKGDAVDIALQSNIFSSLAGQHLRSYVRGESFISAFVKLMEMNVWMLLLAPFALLRRTAVVILCAFHLAIFTFMSVGLLPILGIVSCLPFWGIGRQNHLPTLLPFSTPTSESKMKDLIFNWIVPLIFSVILLYLTIKAYPKFTPGAIDHLLTKVGLSQSWRMYSPYPPTDPVFLQMTVRLTDDNGGKTMPILRYFDQSSSLIGTDLRRHRWKMVHAKMASQKFSDLRPIYATTLIRIMRSRGLIERDSAVLEYNFN